MAKAITSEKIRLPEVRLSFPQLVEPKMFAPGQKARFEASALLDPSNAAHAAALAKVQSEALRIVKQKWGQDADPKKLGIKLCVQSGDDKPYDGYAGMKVISTAQPEDPTGKDRGRPLIVNRNGQPIMPGDPEWPYGGCYVNINITLWTQDNQFGKRINANLIAVQFVKKGPAFGRAPVNAADEFEKLPQDAAAATVDGEADPFG